MIPFYFEVTIAFFYGAVLGSFLNVCIYRIPRSGSLWRPGSRCPACGKPIAYYDNIPLLSYLILRGRCRHCSAGISPRYPLVELVTAAVTAGTMYLFGFSYEFLFYTAFCYFMILLMFIDYYHQILPNRLTLPGALVGLAGSFFLEGRQWPETVIGMVGGPLFLLLLMGGYYIVRGQEGMGMGDVKMAALMGAFLGWSNLVVAVLLSSLMGTVTGLAVIALRKGDFETALPYGTFLGAGGIFAVFWGEAVIKWYISLFP